MWNLQKPCECMIGKNIPFLLQPAHISGFPPLDSNEAYGFPPPFPNRVKSHMAMTLPEIKTTDKRPSQSPQFSEFPTN
jgi:hypothetical protein